MPSGSKIDRRIPKTIENIPAVKKTSDTHQEAKDAPATTINANTKEKDSSINTAISSSEEFSGTITQAERNTTRYITKTAIVETITLLNIYPPNISSGPRVSL